MQRLATSFPSGVRGAGLLMLRLVTSFTVLYAGRVLLIPLALPVYMLCIVKIISLLSIILVVIGLLAPVGSIVLSLELVGVVAFSPAARPDAGAGRLLVLCLVVMLLVIASSGPGALSLDARLFGRREMILPD